MVELLLENGANPNIHDKQERKPIHWASFVGYTEIIRILKKYGADINSVDKEVSTNDSFFLAIIKITLF